MEVGFPLRFASVCLKVQLNTASRSTEVQTEHHNGELSDFEHDLVVGARRPGLSISETADLLRFFMQNHL